MTPEQQELFRVILEDPEAVVEATWSRWRGEVALQAAEIDRLRMENELLKSEVSRLKRIYETAREKESVAEEAIYASTVLGRAYHESPREKGLLTKLAHAEDKVASILVAMREAGLPPGTTVDQFGGWLRSKVEEVNAYRRSG